MSDRDTAVAEVRRHLDLVQEHLVIFTEMLNDVKSGQEDPEEALEIIQGTYTRCKDVQREIKDLLGKISLDNLNPKLNAEWIHVNEELKSMFTRYEGHRSNLVTKSLEQTRQPKATLPQPKLDRKPYFLDFRGKPKLDVRRGSNSQQPATVAPPKHARVTYASTGDVGGVASRPTQARTDGVPISSPFGQIEGLGLKTLMYLRAMQKGVQNTTKSSNTGTASMPKTHIPVNVRVQQGMGQGNSGPSPRPLAQTQNPLAIPKDPRLQVIHVIFQDVLSLQKRVEAFTGKSRKAKDYLDLDEILTRNLLKLDEIVTEGREDVRQARKDCVKLIQDTICELEAKAPVEERKTE